MNKRELLRTLGAIGAVGVPAAMLAQQSPHMHGAAPHQALVAAASDCAAKGQICLAHCYENLVEGDKSLGACAKSVEEMVVLCGALTSVAAQNAPSLPKLAAVVLDACRRCEAECRKHENEHSQCKNCAEACVACAAECKKVASA